MFDFVGLPVSEFSIVKIACLKTGFYQEIAR